MTATRGARVVLGRKPRVHTVLVEAVPAAQMRHYPAVEGLVANHTRHFWEKLFSMKLVILNNNKI